MLTLVSVLYILISLLTFLNTSAVFKFRVHYHFLLVTMVLHDFDFEPGELARDSTSMKGGKAVLPLWVSILIWKDRLQRKTLQQKE